MDRVFDRVLAYQVFSTKQPSSLLEKDHEDGTNEYF